MGWCREALRRTPHNPVLVRETVAPVDLDGVLLPAGTRVFAWTQAAMQDAAGFPEPRRMRPDREPRSYLHFGGALHACAGRRLNDLQIPMLVALLLRRGIEETGRVGWAGPFPAHLPLRLRRTR
ncbi:MAG: cytochrome P450 [Rhodospirillales bacterium]